MADVEGLVLQYDETHTIGKKAHRLTRAFGDCRWIASLQSNPASQPRCVPFPRAKFGNTRPYVHVVSCRHNSHIGHPMWGKGCLPHAIDDAAGTLHRLGFSFKLDAHRINFLKPSFSSKILDILDERVRRRQKQDLVTLLGTVVPSMLKESIEIEVFFSAKVLRAGS